MTKLSHNLESVSTSSLLSIIGCQLLNQVRRWISRRFSMRSYSDRNNNKKSARILCILLQTITHLYHSSTSTSGSKRIVCAKWSIHIVESFNQSRTPSQMMRIPLLCNKNYTSLTGHRNIFTLNLTLLIWYKVAETRAYPQRRNITCMRHTLKTSPQRNIIWSNKELELGSWGD